jgi:hypothetical protein
MPFNPDKWATSLFESLKEYVDDNIHEVYDVVMGYPDADSVASLMPLPKTMIHFEIDDPRQVPFGFGDNVVNRIYNEGAGTVEEWEAHCHEVRIEVGVWASVESGGVSARLEARQDLDGLFNGPSARESLMTHTNGVELLAFTGGQFVTDRINDLPVFRIVDMELRVRVFSRTKKVPIPFIDEVDQSPGLVIDDNVTING